MGFGEGSDVNRCVAESMMGQVDLGLDFYSLPFTVTPEVG